MRACPTCGSDRKSKHRFGCGSKFDDTGRLVETTTCLKRKIKRLLEFVGVRMDGCPEPGYAKIHVHVRSSTAATKLFAECPLEQALDAIDSAREALEDKKGGEG